MYRITNWLKSNKWLMLNSFMIAVLAVTAVGRVDFGKGDSGVVIKLGYAYDVLAAGTVDYTYNGTNDNIPWQAALNALPSSGGRLVDVSGVTKHFSATVTRAIGNVTIVGTGKGSLFANNGAAVIFQPGGNNWAFYDCAFDSLNGINQGVTTGWIEENVWLGTLHYAFRSTDGETVASSFTTDNASVTSFTNSPVPVANATQSWGSSIKQWLTGWFVNLVAGTVNATHINTTTLNATTINGGTTNLGINGALISLIDAANLTFAELRGSQSLGNVFLGWNAGANVTTGDSNVAMGRNSALFLTTGSANAFFGRHAGRTTTNGSYNTFIGDDAGINNDAGQGNTAVGLGAMRGAGLSVNLTQGNYNTFMGFEAGYGNNGSYNIGIGRRVGSAGNDTPTTGSNNIIIGDYLNVASPTANYQLNFGTLFQGTLPYVNGNNITVFQRDSGVGLVGIMDWVSATDPYVNIGRNDTGVATNTVTEHLRLTAASGGANISNNFGYQIGIYMPNSANTMLEQAKLRFVESGATPGAEQTQFYLDLMYGGSIVNPLRITPVTTFINNGRIALTTLAGEPAYSNGQVSLYSWTLGGNQVLGLTTGQNTTSESLSSNSTLTIRINGATYKLLLASQ